MLRIKFTSGAGLVVLSGALGMCLASATLIAAEPKPEPKSADAKTLALGRELFEREWLPNDPRAHGGDGLGPVFNESSCVACHNQGGSGGGGAESKNVHLVTAINNGQQPQPAPQVVSEIERSRLGPALRGVMKSLDSALLTGHQLRQQFDQERLQREQAEHFKKRVQQIHPGLATSRSLVLHRFGTDREYSKWRDQITGVAQNLGVMGQFGDPLDESAEAAKLAALPTPEISVAQQAVAAISRLKEAFSTSEPTAPEPTPQSFPNSMTERQIVLTTAQSFRFGGGQGQFENVSFVTSQRNSTSLFGAGLIDGIPDRVLDDAAKVTHPNFPEISGRVARMKDGKIGRFGWKSQKAHLYEFAMTACAYAAASFLLPGLGVTDASKGTYIGLSIVVALVGCEVQPALAEAVVRVLNHGCAENLGQTVGQCAAIPVVSHTAAIVALANQIADGIIVDMVVLIQEL